MTMTERNTLFDAMMYALDLDGNIGEWKANFVNEYIDKIQKQDHSEPVSRLEVINHATNDRGIGRLLTMHKELGDFQVLEVDYQDGGKTLKIFLS